MSELPPVQPPLQPPQSSPPPPPVQPAPESDVDKNKVFAVLSYLGILWLVPLLAAKDSPFAKFHCNQGLVLFISYFIAASVCGMCMIIPFVGCVAFPLLLAIALTHFIFMILGIINAAQGQMKRLPLVGNWTILK